MDAERFELTEEELETELYWNQTELIRRCIKAQVAKVLSLFEPVELEALGEGEMEVIAPDTNAYHTRIISQATVRKNQAKGQLFRLKE